MAGNLVQGAVFTVMVVRAGMLRPLTVEGGLSLGDRYCLALAKLEGLPALTAERRWSMIAEAAGVVIEIIR